MEAPILDLVKMYHPELNAVGEAVREGFYMLYASRGWVLMEGPAADATELLGRPVLKVKDLTNDEIRQLLGSYGVEQPDSKATKNDLVKMVSVAAGGQALEIDEDEDKSDDESEQDDADEPEKDESTSRPKPSGAAKKAAAKKQGS